LLPPIRSVLDEAGPGKADEEAGRNGLLHIALEEGCNGSPEEDQREYPHDDGPDQDFRLCECASVQLHDFLRQLKNQFITWSLYHIEHQKFISVSKKYTWSTL
jgi:hypothetical protein